MSEPHDTAVPDSRAPQSSQPHRDAWDAMPPDPVPAPAPVPPKPAIRWLTFLFLMPLIAVATFSFAVLSLLVALWDPTGRQQHLVARTWARTLLLLSLSPVKVIGRAHLDPSQPAVYASNHLSYYDTPLVFAKLPFQFRIFAKQSLWKAPFIGWYLNRSGQVPIDIESGRSAVAGLIRGVKTLQSGLSLFIFPEGGRAATGIMTPFQSGAAYMAIKAQVPLVPLALVGTYELLPIHVYHITPRPMALVIGAPLSTEGLTTRDAEALTARLAASISEMYAAHQIQ